MIHRDYLYPFPIQIKVFADKLHIANVGSIPADWTKEKLLGNHSSAPHNSSIARTFYKAGYIESWGRGIEKIFTSCEEHGIPHPDYEVLESLVTVYFLNPRLSEKASKETSTQILGLIKRQPQLTAVEMAEVIGITPKGIRYHLDRLKKEQLIRHVGPTKKGHWEIIRENHE